MNAEISLQQIGNNRQDEGMSECVGLWVSVWVDDCVRESEWVIVCVCVNELVSEWVSEWVGGWLSAWEWMSSECVRVNEYWVRELCVCLCMR